MRNKVLILLLFISLGGCVSGKRQIADEARKIRRAATQTVVLLDAILDSDNKEEIDEHANKAIDHQTSIVKRTEKINTALPKVEDKVSIWASIVNNLIWIGLMGLILFGLIYFNTGALIRPIFTWAGSFLKKTIRKVSPNVQNDS